MVEGEAMKVISVGEETYAILAPLGEIKDGSEWFGEPYQPLQVSLMKYPAGKEFRAHKHLINPRIIKRTQEVFIVISGKISIDIFDEDKTFLGMFEAGPGDAIMVYKGYHLVRVIEDAVAYEAKAGQYSGPISEEKDFKDV